MENAVMGNNYFEPGQASLIKTSKGIINLDAISLVEYAHEEVYIHIRGLKAKKILLRGSEAERFLVALSAVDVSKD